MGIGLIAGIGTAIIAGQIAGKPSNECGSSTFNVGCSRGEMTTIFLLPSSLLGAFFGSVIGGGRKTFVFGEDKNNLKAQEAALQKFAYPH